MSGRLGDLSADQQSKLATLRRKINDVITPRCDDQYLLRFLRSRNFNLEKSEDKIRQTLEFRRKWGADTILDDWTPPPLCVQFFPEGFTGRFDQTKGFPVSVLCLGSFDLKGLMKCVNREDLIKYKVYAMEKIERELKESTEKQGKLIDMVTVILDLNGLSAYHLWRPSLNLFNEFMQIEEKHYPEIVSKGFIIRAPKIFPTIYALVKPFIDPNTREKLEFLGSGYKDRILDYIGADNLPEVFGGNLKETPRICWGGKIPKDLYKENDESLQHQYVKPGRNFVIEVEVEEIGHELSWEFLTENHDIGFGVYFVQEGKRVEILPSERTPAHLGSIESTITCEKKGVYVLEWDNGFSWAKGKNLRYKYEVGPPKREESS